MWAFCVNSAVLRAHLSGWKKKNVAKLAPHQQIFVGAHFFVATVASGNLAQAVWKKPFATHLHSQSEMQRVETENRCTGTGDAAQKRCGLQHCKMGGWHRPFIFLFSSG